MQKLDPARPNQIHGARFERGERPTAKLAIQIVADGSFTRSGTTQLVFRRASAVATTISRYRGRE